MATKKNTSSTKLMKKKADDAVVYQVMAALVLLCCGLLGLRSLRAYYSTIGGFSALYDVSYLIESAVRCWRWRASWPRSW